MIWVCETGVEVEIKDMTNLHILNAIKWLRKDDMYGSLLKDGYQDLEWVQAFTIELMSRGYDI